VPNANVDECGQGSSRLRRVCWPDLSEGCDGHAHRTTVEAAITVSSTAFIDGDTIPPRYTCDGANVSPLLTVVGVPSGTQELATLVEDPDAPGGTFVHWVAWGSIRPTPRCRRQRPHPSTGTNGFGRRGYGCPYPPRGAPHRYIFTVFALSRRLGLPPGASADQFRWAVADTAIAQGRFTGRYGRPDRPPRRAH
jgi:Raf kinase inhibitor-like YbhB/YbcL family protein